MGCTSTLSPPATQVIPATSVSQPPIAVACPMVITTMAGMTSVMNSLSAFTTFGWNCYEHCCYIRVSALSLFKRRAKTAEADLWRMEVAIPKLLFAVPPKDAPEERQLRKLPGSRHATGDWIQRTRLIARSWDGLRTTAIAVELGCHPQTVRKRIVRFNVKGIDGLGDRREPGRKL